jgi:1-acyl-sn-glycerol-3-phosphate acyltransferase
MSQEVRKASPRLYELLRRVFVFLEWLLLKVEVSGTENVPREGAFLAVINHLSIADPTMVYVHIPRQMVMFVADKWKNTPGISHLANTVGAIWVARGEADLSAIKQAVAALKSGQPLGIAPEGTRSPTHRLQRAKTGAAYLADRANVPILPMALSGTERLGENLRRLRRTPVRLVVGKPFRLPPHGRAKADVLEAYTDLIMCHMAALLPPEYRGVYADHPQLKALTQDANPA